MEFTLIIMQILMQIFEFSVIDAENAVNAKHQNIILIKNKLFEIEEALKNEMDNIAEHVERDSFEINILEDLHPVLTHIQDAFYLLNELINEYQDKAGVISKIIEQQKVLKIEVSDLINNQEYILKLLQNTLLFPLNINNIWLVQRLCNIVFYHKGSVGFTAQVEHKARIFLIAITGFMIIKKFKGKFVKADGLCIKLQSPACLLEIENQCKQNRDYSGWLTKLNIHLTAYRSEGTFLPKNFKGISRL